MISTVRTFTIQEGKQQQAIAMLVKATSYLKETYGANVHVERNITGPLNKVHIVGEYESMAALESVQKKAQADEKLRAMLSEAPSLQTESQTLLLLERVS